MTDKRKKNRRQLTFYKLKKKSLTEKTQVTAALKKDLQLPFLSDKLFSGILLVFHLISLIAFAKLHLNLVTALFFVHKSLSNLTARF